MSNFFITAPGADMPLCHHLIECIKLKSIPITPDLLDIVSSILEILPKLLSTLKLAFITFTSSFYTFFYRKSLARF